MADNDVIDRRSVLKSMATGAALVVGATGIGSAKTGKAPVSRAEHDAAVEGYEDSKTVREVFAEHEDMLKTLAEEGLVESASANDLFIDLDGDVRDDGHEHVSSVRRTDGSVTPEIKITRNVNGERLTFAVRPETGVQWALRGQPDSQDPTVYEDVTTMSCCSCCGYEKYCCWSCCTPCVCPPDCQEWCYECSCPDGCC